MKQRQPIKVKQLLISTAMVLVGLFSLVTSVQNWGIFVSVAGIVLGILLLRKFGSSTGVICGTALSVISLCMGLMFVVTAWMMESDPQFKASMEQQIEQQFKVELEDGEAEDEGE